MEAALPDLILSAMAFIAGYAFGRTAEMDRWRRPADADPGAGVEIFAGGKRYLVRRDDPPSESTSS